jgi:MoaA/NifB/PqqE/SkfB family radical SAM enzyme
VTIECLQIEPTTRCNFTCGFCCGRAMTQSDLDFSLFLRTLDQFPSVKQIELQGEGEPLMHARYFEMLAAARARGIGVSLVTNGSHFTDEAVDRLLAGGVEKLSVSLESADPATFRAIRGGKLEKVITGLERLMAERRKRGLDRPLVGLCVTLLKRTAGDLDGIFALYRRLGLDGGITAQPLQKMSAYAEVYDPATAAQQLDPREADYRLIAFYRRARKVQRERWAKGGFHARLMGNWRPTSRRCPWLERGLYVNRDGAVTPCCMIKKDEHALGRIGDPVGPMLAARDAMRAQLSDGKTPAACEGCEIARYAVMTPTAAVRRAAVVGLRVLRSVVTGVER